LIIDALTFSRDIFQMQGRLEYRKADEQST
jgi:hypothetical protein